ncbi:hypothetical protein FSP39_011697 [Pinctada imbricata]|uniref:Uncharacterized protein n=1 Tax=Pinctada imbricata TaxID=66713 RepID=A0AA89C7C5_PINIB|nr:hypothetical protein FSP39_011697 [Pinctada imbricata]
MSSLEERREARRRRRQQQEEAESSGVAAEEETSTRRSRRRGTEDDIATEETDSAPAAVDSTDNAEAERAAQEAAEAEERRRQEEAAERRRREEEEDNRRAEEEERRREEAERRRREEEERAERERLEKEEAEREAAIIMKKAADELKAQALAKAEERERYINERVPPCETDGKGEAELIKLCKSLHDVVAKLEEELYDTEQKIRKQDYDINQCVNVTHETTSNGKGTSLNQYDKIPTYISIKYKKGGDLQQDPVAASTPKHESSRCENTKDEDTKRRKRDTRHIHVKHKRLHLNQRGQWVTDADFGRPFATQVANGVVILDYVRTTPLTSPITQRCRRTYKCGVKQHPHC